MRKLGNEKMREWEKWGKCQKYQTTNFAQVSNLGKVWDEKATVGTVRRIRKEAEEFGREEGEFLMKKAYRKLIRILDDWYRKGI